MVLIDLPLPLRETLEDFVTARGPEPPAATGLPTPSRVWSSFAFLVRGGGGCCRSITSGGKVSFSSGSGSSSCSSSVLCMMTEETRLGPALLE